MSYCPDSPRELGLDFDAWWPGQQQTIDVIVGHFLSGTKYVLAAIPTGGGKTIIASAVQKILAREEGEFAGKSLALTHTIQLQQQYQETLTEAAVITGRGNHLCELAPGNLARLFEDPKKPLTAEDAPCATGGGCDEDLNTPQGCSYYRQWWEAADASMVVMNYAFAVRVLPISHFRGHERDANGKVPSIKNPFRRQLLVADECHLAERAVIDGVGVKLWTSTLQSLGIDYPPEYTRQVVDEGGPRSQRQVTYETTSVWVSWAYDHIEQVRAAVESADQDVEAAAAAEPPSSELPRLKARHKSLTALLEALDAVRCIPTPDEYIVRRDESMRPGRDGKHYVISATVQPLFGWAAAPQVLFQYFNRVLLMSATPGDPDVARVTLGIPAAEFVYVERPSTFPVANRPVFYLPVAKLNYKSSDEDWERLVETIYRIAIQAPYDARKGLVHSGSKANAHRIVDLLNRRFGWERAFSHGEVGRRQALSREDALDHFIHAREPLIFVTASFTTGLDLPYLIGWQVIAKIPYGNLGDEITARRRAFIQKNGYDFGNQNYLAESMNTVVQAAGRIVRSPTDSGPTFILDGNYAQLHARAFKPKFYLDAFRRVEREPAS